MQNQNLCYLKKFAESKLLNDTNMNLIQFIRIILRNSLILFLIPLLMAVLVYFLTGNNAKTFTSKTLIYTGIASGYSIESGENSRVDFFASNNALDNLQNIIKSKQTLEAVSMRLFAQNMMLTATTSKTISRESFDELQRIVPEDVRNLVDTSSIENTINRFTEYKNRDDENFIYKLFYLFHRHYSLDALSKIIVKRIGNSDLIEISYSNDDPAICYQTLDILNSEFIYNYKGLKGNQTDAVVKYFEEQLNLTSARLNKAEDDLANFNRDNKIINYYEQTKHVASLEEKFQIQYQSELLALNGALASIKDLESKMGSTQKIKLQANEIINLLNELSEITGKIAINQIFNTDSTASDIPDKSDLYTQSANLKRRLANAVDSMYDLENTSEGIDRGDLVKDWLSKIIIYEETRSRIEVLDAKRKEFDGLYTRYAPLGATVKRIEREIGVVEQEYLTVLHSLSTAKLKQQNIQLSTGLKIIDSPVFPINPLPSKRKFFVIVAFMVGFISILTIIFVLEYFDATIKNSERAEQQINLKVEGLFPKMLESKKYEIGKVAARAVDYITKKLYLKTIEGQNLKILFISMTEGEGKSYLVGEIARTLSSNDNKVAVFTPDSGSFSSDMEGIECNNYKMNTALIHSSSFFKPVEDIKNGFLLAELPSIDKNPIPAGIFQEADFIFLVCRANRSWREADAKSLELIRHIGVEPQILLNGVDPENMETFLGEIPRKRSFVRKFVKKVLNKQFKVSESII